MKKKFKYALGEILIVIIGISLAFGMNKCGEQKTNQTLKIQYLENLKQDINADKEQLNNNLTAIEEKIGTSQDILGKMTNNEPLNPRLIYQIASITNFTPSDFTYQALVNSGDLKLINDLELKKAIEKHYASYNVIAKAYERQEIINKDYLGKYFIYDTDYDLIKEGKSPFKDKKLLKNIIQSVRGSFVLKLEATKAGIKGCDSILKHLKLAL